MKQFFTSRLVFSTLTALFIAGLAGEVVAAERPNVIFVLTDDLGYSDVSCYGATKVKTLHIDRLAAEGLRFTDFHTAASICSPSRAAFLTGAYPQRAGLYMGINPNRTAHWFLGLSQDEITLAEQFKEQGYDTCMVGKWHLGTEPEFSMLKQGFDEYHGMPCNFAHSPKFFDGEELTFPTTPLDRLTELYTDRVTSYIRKQGDKPFFLYYAHNYPHTPFKAGAKFKGSSKDGVRGDIMQELDWGIGEMMKALEETGAAQNTLVVFTSDNGPTKNAYARPYRGTKYVTFEGGHRVPFILHWPTRIKEARVIDAPINAMDLFPTLSEIIGAPMPEDRIYDGLSLVPLLKGENVARSLKQPFFYYNCENLQAVRMGDWKLHLPRTKEQLPHWEKNKAFVGMENPILYNLGTDAAESVDVASKHPEIVDQILTLAKDARAELGEYMQRGTGQRPTGTAIPGAPIIGNEKDWEIVESAMAEEIARERTKRHPGAKTKKRATNADQTTPRKTRRAAAENRSTEEPDNRSTSPKPNVVLIMVDDLGAECIGAYGGTSYETPRIDSLAAQGLRFENAFSMPLCGPTRACILSGRYPFRSGVAGNQGVMGFTEPWGRGKTPEITFAHLMKEQGYATAIAGKWALCKFDISPDHVVDCGFDHYRMWPKIYNGEMTHRYWDPDRFEDGGFHPRTKGVFGPDQECDYIIDFITEHSRAERDSLPEAARRADAGASGNDQPFLAYWPMTLIHGPLENPPGFDGKEGNLKGARFAANVNTIDRLVGRIVDAIDELGLGKKTLILFTCDNGTAGKVSSRLGERVIQGGKGQVNDAGTRVPLVARWTSTIHPGGVSRDLIDFSDFLPTLAELSGTAVPTDRVIDGRSFAPQLRGETGMPRDWVYIQNDKKIIVRGKRCFVNPAGQLFDLSDRYAPKPIKPDQTSEEIEAARKRLLEALKSVRGDAKLPAKKGTRRKK